MLGVLALLLLPGCGDTYSDAITYELRQDPFFKEKAPTLPADSPFQYKADPPGQLPLLKMAAVNDQRNPFNPELFLNRKAIDQAEDKAKERQKQLDAFYGLFIDPAKVRAESCNAGITSLANSSYDRSVACGSAQSWASRR